MKNYQFYIGDERGLSLYFSVVANSRKEAVKLANEEIAEPDESSSIHLRMRTRHAFVNLDENFRVNESMIIDESLVSHVLPKKAYDFLLQQGYALDYDYEDQDLFYDETPQFTKSLKTESGDIYGFFQVSTKYEYNTNDFTYCLNAILYPLKSARIIDGRGGLNYRVIIEDGQLYITLDELPSLLELYEQKFEKLITALRLADPDDGLPL